MAKLSSKKARIYEIVLVLRKNSISSVSETKLSKRREGSFLLKYRAIRIFQNHDRDNSSAPGFAREQAVARESKDKWGPSYPATREISLRFSTEYERRLTYVSRIRVLSPEVPRERRARDYRPRLYRLSVQDAGT